MRRAQGRRMNPRPWLLLCCSLGCGDATLNVGSRASEDETASLQHGLKARVQEKFGADARVQQVFGREDEVLLGVALSEAFEESDVRAPLALATYKRSADTIEVVSAEAGFHEARRLGSALATVSITG